MPARQRAPIYLRFSRNGSEVLQLRAASIEWVRPAGERSSLARAHARERRRERAGGAVASRAQPAGSLPARLPGALALAVVAGGGEMAELQAAKSAFAAEQGIAACTNAACGFAGCTCGGACACGPAAKPGDTGVCDPCVDFKRERAAAQQQQQQQQQQKQQQQQQQQQ